MFTLRLQKHLTFFYCSNLPAANTVLIAASCSLVGHLSVLKGLPEHPKFLYALTLVEVVRLLVSNHLAFRNHYDLFFLSACTLSSLYTKLRGLVQVPCISSGSSAQCDCMVTTVVTINKYSLLLSV